MTLIVTTALAMTTTMDMPITIAITIKLTVTMIMTKTMTKTMTMTLTKTMILIVNVRNIIHEESALLSYIICLPWPSTDLSPAKTSSCPQWL